MRTRRWYRLSPQPHLTPTKAAGQASSLIQQISDEQSEAPFFCAKTLPFTLEFSFYFQYTKLRRRIMVSLSGLNSSPLLQVWTFSQWDSPTIARKAKELQQTIATNRWYYGAYLIELVYCSEEDCFALQLYVSAVTWYRNRKKYAAESVSSLVNAYVASLDPLPAPLPQCGHPLPDVYCVREGCSACSQGDEVPTHLHLQSLTPLTTGKHSMEVVPCTEQIQQENGFIRACGFWVHPQLRVELSLNDSFMTHVRRFYQQDMLITPVAHKDNAQLIGDSSMWEFVKDTLSELKYLNGGQHAVSRIVLNFGLWESNSKDNRTPCHGHLHLHLTNQAKITLEDILVSADQTFHPMRGLDSAIPDYKSNDAEVLLRLCCQ